MSQDIMATQKGQSRKKISWGSLKFTHFAGNSAEGLASWRECCWGYVYIYENIPKKFPHLSPKRCCNIT